MEGYKKNNFIVWHNKKKSYVLHDFIMYSNDEKTDMILIFGEQVLYNFF
jgi:hypothetical protein